MAHPVWISAVIQKEFEKHRFKLAPTNVAFPNSHEADLFLGKHHEALFSQVVLIQLKLIILTGEAFAAHIHYSLKFIQSKKAPSCKESDTLGK